MRKPALFIAAAMIAAAAIAAIAADFTVTVVSADGTTITPPASAAAPSLADAASPAASYIATSEGRWTFGSPPDAAGDYPLLLNGSAAAGGLAAISAQVTNGNLYARTKASGHYWCRFAAAWYDVGAASPKEGTMAVQVTITPSTARTPEDAPAGTTVAQIAVTMVPTGEQFTGALVSSNPLFRAEGASLVLTRAYTAADLGQTYTTRVTALTQ